ncbi:MAG: Cys-tRNA(Pro) deacylase [Bermanella sp.]
MTPAVNALKKSKTPYNLHEYSHNPASDSYGSEAAEKLGISASQVFKTLVVSLDNKALAVAVVPVSSKLSMKQVAKALAAKKAVMANPAEVERVTGYVLGGVSPLGQKKTLKTVIDSSAKDLSSIFISAGRRGLEIEINPVDLAKLTRASFYKVSQ